MARMMGTQQELDLLTSLLFTVTNEAQYKERVVKLHEMTTVHRQALDAAVKAKGEAEAAVRNADAVTADRTQKAAEAEVKATAALRELETSKAAYETRVKSANDEIQAARAAHADRVASDKSKLQADTEAHRKAVTEHAKAAIAHAQAVRAVEEAHDKKEQAFKGWEKRLNVTFASITEREGKLAAAEADLAARAKKVRDLFTSAA